LTFLTTSTKEVPPLYIIEMHHKVIDILNEYFKKLSDSVIRENFATIYQLLDEMIDGGFASTTEANTLKEMIAVPSLARRMLQGVTGEFSVKQSLPTGALSKIPWRKGNVKYVTNEIYFDLVEQIDAIISSEQQVITANVYGDIKCNCRLTGMPDLTLTFTRPSLLDDCSLHRCVRINRYQRERQISFVPPDGKFKLLSYRVGGDIRMPVFVKPQINYGPNNGRVYVTVGSKYASDKPVTELVVIIPLTKATRSISLSANVGTVKPDQITKVVRWEIGRLPKEKTPTLEGTISLPPDYVVDEAPTITAEFVVKMTTASGLKVEGLAIKNVKYKPFKGVRSVVTAGKFQIRC